MADDLAGANVNRLYSNAGTSIAIFTFVLFFLYPRFRDGEIDPVLFQLTLAVMGVVTFSFVVASFHYYCASVGQRLGVAEKALHARQGDRLWLLGSTLLFLVPSLILVTIELYLVTAVWGFLWLIYLRFALRQFPKVQAGP